MRTFPFLFVCIGGTNFFNGFLFSDYVIPKGCFVVPFLSAVHLDESLYKGAVDFNPWRWMDPENQVS